ncbi:MAG: hypothetical protein HN350_03050 [Phycisphaerales bacterium]|jgi:hypothetical protein|nr:hypothetical protein [Phycisphaerales bacterium]
MEDSDNVYYDPSGRFSLSGLLIMFSVALGAGVLLGGVYGVLVYLSPVGILNLFAMCWMAWLVGKIVGRGTLLGKVRNRWLYGLGGLLAGLATIWAAWVCWAYFFSSDFGPGVLDLNPVAIWNYIVYIAENAEWRFFGFDQPVNGIPMYILWGLEASLVVGVVYVVSMLYMSDKLFCERCNCWVTERIKLPRLDPPQDESMIEAVQNRDISGILTLPAYTTGDKHIQVELLKCQKCQELYAAHVFLMARPKRKDDKAKFMPVRGAANLRLTLEEYQTLLEFKGVAPTPAPSPAV